MKRLMFLISLLFSFSVAGFDYEPTLENFFQLYEAGRKANAVELVYLNNRDRNKVENFKHVGDKQKELTEQSAALGTYYGFELLGKHEIGTRLKHFTYILYHEEGPMRLEFEYYKPHKKWLLTDLQIDVNLGQELKTLARNDIAGYLVKDDISGPFKKK